MCSEGTLVSAQTHRLGRPLKPEVEAVDDGEGGGEVQFLIISGSLQAPGSCRLG